MLIYVGIFFALIFGWYGVKKIMFMWFIAHYQPPSVTISATNAESKTWQSYLSAVGTFTAINGVDISAEVAGIIEEIRFTSGQLIKKGEPLFILRNDVEQANLKSNQARLQLAQINYDREKTLYHKHVTSQSQLDIRYAELLEAQGSVESVQAQIKQKTITAPFDGKLGIRQVNLGQYVAPNTIMVTLQSLNPLYVMFSVPEQYLTNLSLGQDIDVTVNFGNQEIIAKGKITAMNAKVEQTTRNILVEATIPNDKNELYPGMYGLVKVWLPARQNTIVVPQTAISYSLSGDYIFIIKDEKDENKLKDDEHNLHVYRQYVKVGERRGDEVAILEGLNVGDKIVTSGQLKLQNGTHVTIDNRVKL